MIHPHTTHGDLSTADSVQAHLQSDHGVTVTGRMSHRLLTRHHLRDHADETHLTYFADDDPLNPRNDQRMAAVATITVQVFAPVGTTREDATRIVDSAKACIRYGAHTLHGKSPGWAYVIEKGRVLTDPFQSPRR